MDMPAGQKRPKISATDAAFAGFGLARRNLGAFVVWTVIYLLYSLAALGLQLWLVGPTMAKMAAMQSTGSTPPSTEEAMQALAGLGNLSGFYVAIMVIALAYGAVMNAAIFRAALKPAERGLAYLRFGKDELRQAGASFIVGLVIYGVYIVAVMVGVILAVVAVIGVVAMTGGKEADFAGNPAAIATAVVAGVLVVLAIVVPVLVVAVRLSLAGPNTFMRGKVDVFGSWRLTKGRFWTLAGAYLLSSLVIVVFSTLVMVVVVIVALVAGVSLDTVSHTIVPEAKTMDLYLSPLRLALTVINAPLTTLWVVVQASIPATIYAQAAAGRDPSGPAAVDRSNAFGSAVAYPTPATSPASPPPDAL